jgi:transcriptional regulator with XRE-family HTH domain
MRRGDLSALHNLRSIGRWLIGARIGKGWSLSDLADALDVSVHQVFRDESNQYQDISTERAQPILDALGLRFPLEVEEPIPQDSNDQEAVPT